MAFEGFEIIPVLPLDEAFAITAAFNADTDPRKVSLGAGVYRDENAKPWVLPSVKRARQKLIENPHLNHEYLPIQGLDGFLNLAKELVLGHDLATQSNAASFQTISGTGANHLGALFLAQQLKPKNVFISNPTWGNHHLIWTIAAPNVVQKTYPYWDAEKRSLDFDGWCNALESDAVENDVVILHACAHNPTGVDPTQEQWKALCQLFKRKRLIPFFDSAYQGFASGSTDKDAWAVRHFQQELINSQTERESHGVLALCTAQSFAKNFGLYGERVGAFHLTLPSHVSTLGSYSQLCRLARAEISTPPLFGARIVEMILSDADLKASWEQDLRKMSSRIIGVRRLLKEAIEKRPGSGDWSHLVTQIGMFSYTGLTEAHVLRLREKHHIYMLRNGRASLSGVNATNVEYIAAAFAEVMSQ